MGHFQSTKDRIRAIPDDPILILQDTTEFSYHRDNQDAISSNLIVPTNKDLFGKPIRHKKMRNIDAFWFSHYRTRSSIRTNFY